LPIESETSTFGYARENPEIANGTKYFAVLTAPMEIRPAVFPAIISSEVSQDAIAASIRSTAPALHGRHRSAACHHWYAGSAEVPPTLQVAKLKGDRGLGEMKLLGCRGHRSMLLNGRQCRNWRMVNSRKNRPAIAITIIRKTLLAQKITKFH